MTWAADSLRLPRFLVVWKDETETSSWLMEARAARLLIRLRKLFRLLMGMDVANFFSISVIKRFVVLKDSISSRCFVCLITVSSSKYSRIE